MDKLDLNVPISFEKLNTYQIGDTRFIPVKIWILHLEENLNGSYFTKESVEEALPSLSNTPILAYIEKNKNDEKDFSDHRIELEVTKDDIKLSYKGSAIGVIPESNDAKFEDRLCDDGITRTFLTCQGLVWTKWDDPQEIFERDLIKGQSMELDENYYEGHFNENGYFVFTKFRFFGACALGDSVTPAMKNSTIEVNFSVDEIKSKLEQYQNYINQSSIKEVDINSNNEGGNKLNEELQKVLDKYNVSVESLNFSIEGMSVEELETKLESEFAENNKKSDEVQSTFSATYNQKREALRNAFGSEIVRDNDGNLLEETYYYVEDFSDEYVYVEKSHWTKDNYESKYGRYGYSYEESTLTATITGEFEEMVKVWLTLEENAKLQEERTKFELIKTEYEEYKTNYSTPNSEVEILVQFKSSKLSEERENDELNIFSKFEEKIGDTEEFTELKANAKNFSIKELEKECLCIVGLYSEITKDTKAKEKVKFSVDKTTDDEADVYGGLFKKFLNK
jgi:hypothetical protein